MRTVLTEDLRSHNRANGGSPVDCRVRASSMTLQTAPSGEQACTNKLLFPGLDLSSELQEEPHNRGVVAGSCATVVGRAVTLVQREWI